MDSGVFVFKFNYKEDKQMVLENGPWTVARKPLFFRAWNPNLEMEKINLKAIPIWVSQLGLPFQFWSKENLTTIGSVIGKPLYIDRFTKSRERLSYARLCVKIDAAKDLSNTVTIITEDGGTHT